MEEIRIKFDLIQLNPPQKSSISLLLAPETAFINISVNEFNVFMNMFHFTKIDRKTNYKYLLNNEEGILDKITWQHVIDKIQMENFNFHKKAPRDDDFINELMKDL